MGAIDSGLSGVVRLQARPGSMVEIPYWKQHPEIWNIPCHICDWVGKSKGGLNCHITRKHSKGDITFSRVYANPSKDTFTIKPIRELLAKYVCVGKWIDPFAGDNSLAGWTNDHNPDKKTTHHMEAIDFVNMFDDKSFDGALFDPPYSYRQVSDHYKVIGKKATQLDTSTNFYNRVLNPLANKIKKGGYCIHFGWNTNAMGKNRGFEIVEILIVAHGGHHNDTLVTVERKI